MLADPRKQSVQAGVVLPLPGGTFLTSQVQPERDHVMFQGLNAPSYVDSTETSQWVSFQVSGQET